MVALSDPEDPPANARARQPSVEVVPDGGGGFRTEHPTADNPFYQALSQLEDRIVRRLTEYVDQRFDTVEVELGRQNTHATAVALDVASQDIKPNGLTGRSALVVEPDRYMAKRASYALERLGMKPMIARCREDALMLLEGIPTPFDVALVNIRSPRRADGLDLVRFITRQHRFTATFLMGGGLGAPELSSLLDGLRVGRLPMPFDFETMYERIYDAVGDIMASSETERPPAPFAGSEEDTTPSIQLPELPSTRPDGIAAKREE